MTMRRMFGRLGRSEGGQSLIEGAMVLPVLILVVMGVVELGAALRDQHTISRLSREGSNLISRDVTLDDAAAVIADMATGPIDFDTNARLILSVVKRGGTVGTTNYNQLVLYQRYEYGAYTAGRSRLRTAGSGSFGPAPDYVAANSDTDSGLRLLNAPSGLVSVVGGVAYVTEIITEHALFTTLSRFGVQVPQALYSVAYF